MTGQLTQQVEAAFLPNPPDVLGVAVSGGGDSMALLHLLYRLAASCGIRLHAVTVDHGLRPEAASEAEMVQQYCTSLGIDHDILRWTDWDGTGNLQGAARRARYGLMTEWAADHGISTVALGHTLEDQAETFLMHLARRSGVNGLAGMQARSLRYGVTWVRPMLDVARADLRRYLQARGIDWVDDPSNENMAFERIKARKVLGALGPLGIDAQGLSVVATHMAQARKALDWQAFLAAREIIDVNAGAIIINDRGLRILPDEIQRRIFVHAFKWINNEIYPARHAAVTSVMHALRDSQAATVDGCHARRIGGDIWIFREYNMVKETRSLPGALWDGRWQLAPIDAAGADRPLSIRALGKSGLEQCTDWRASGVPHVVLLSTPAVWQDDVVIAAPLAGCGEKWHAEVIGGKETFFAGLLTH